MDNRSPLGNVNNIISFKVPSLITPNSLSVKKETSQFRSYLFANLSDSRIFAQWR